METGRILIADDDKKGRDVIATFLTYKGYKVFQADDGQDAIEKVARHDPQLVITDLMMPRVNGLGLIKQLKATRPEIPAIAFSAFANQEMIADLLKAGAFFYLKKPFRLEELELLVRQGIENQALQRLTFTAKPEVKNRFLMRDIIGESPKILSILEFIEKIAPSDTHILIQGESGTGKNMVARTIHELSRRKTKSLVTLDCAAIPDDQLEGELFGSHGSGTSRGTITTKIGRLEIADRSTLFIDEVGDLRSNLQKRLLHVMQKRELETTGSLHPKKVDVRIIAATNQNLQNMSDNHDFSRELFSMISVITITIPPLRERKEDIPLLVDAFIDRFNREKQRRIKGADQAVIEMLKSCDWSGNIRELENLVERLVVIKGSGIISLTDLPDKYRRRKSRVKNPEQHIPEHGFCLNSAIEEFENRFILQALERSGGNKKEAALLLNLKRTTLIEKLKKKNILYPSHHPANS
jgi:DNA-binding NtrC family response regulator